MGPVLSTDPRLRECASTYKLRLGQAAEAQVIKHFTNRGFYCLAQRCQTIYAEFDLLFWSKTQGYWIIEVKSSQWSEFWLSKRQAVRLVKLQSYLQHQWRDPVSLALAVVSHDGRCRVGVEPFCELLSGGGYEKLNL